jgi:hypothetical protein
MGVYHLMGLGRSPGAVTGAISYLAHRYERWDNSDRDFFGRSGEVEQREKGGKVGDIQALVLFTSAEIIDGRLLSYPYSKNKIGQKVGEGKDAATMEEIFKQNLPKS